MIRIFPRPGLLAGLVVAASMAGGVIAGALAMSGALAVRAVVKARRA